MDAYYLSDQMSMDCIKTYIYRPYLNPGRPLSVTLIDLPSSRVMSG
jgi:hypothetical protein